jgi:hypothetical protein
MSSGDQQDSGIPTRAIHESYLTLQQSHQQYRRVREQDGDERTARGELQDSVLTFYELLRPHLKHETALSEYWEGKLPDYTGWDFHSARDARQYVQSNSTGVYQVQKHPTTVTVDQQVLADGGVQGWDEWHDLLGLSWDSERLISVTEMSPDEREQIDGEATHYATILRCAVLPLRSLDRWQATVRKQRTSGSGFMSGEAAVETTREYQPAQKLVTAKRLLVEAADRLGALSDFEASTQRTEITREDMEKVEQWRQKQLE